MARPRVTAVQRRARLGRRHHLISPTDEVGTAAGDLVGLHSSDPTTVYLSCWARVAPFEVPDLEGALYDDRTLVRVLGMRRTMFVLPRHLGAVVDAACAKALAPAERRRLVKMVEEQGLAADGDAWVAGLADRVVATLGSDGDATAVELTERVPDLGLKLRFGEGKSWETTVGLSTRILFLLASEGRIVRGRPLGTWLSSQYRWAETTRWLGEPFEPLDVAEARAELARRWLHAFGPGTRTDLKWWTGWTVAQTKQALTDIRAVEVDLDEGTGWLLSDDLAAVDEPDPWVALLPGLDPTVMGWKERNWYLGDHQSALFDGNGNAGPTVWLDGRIVGTWAQPSVGKVQVEVVERIPAAARRRIDGEAERLAAWLGDTVVTPRFPTPLERLLRESAT